MPWRDYYAARERNTRPHKSPRSESNKSYKKPPPGNRRRRHLCSFHMMLSLRGTPFSRYSTSGRGGCCGLGLSMPSALRRSPPAVEPW